MDRPTDAGAVGGIFLHAFGISVQGAISARGGSEGPEGPVSEHGSFGSGGRGGGQMTNWGATPPVVGAGPIDVAGLMPGVVTIAAIATVPEPASLVILSLGLAVVASLQWHHRRVA